MSHTSQPNKIPVILVGAVLTVLLAALVCWASFRPMALEDIRDITVNVTHSDGGVATLEMTTIEDTLWDIPEFHDLVETDEGGYGLYITVMDGEAANTDAGQYWRYDLNGEWTDYAPETQVITDGDVFDFYIAVLET